MRAVIQRVTEATVVVGGEVVGRIDKGLLVYLGIGRGDTDADTGFMADKIVNLRVFADSSDRMNLSVQDVGGAVLLVSQFTLYGDCRKGRRPSFDPAAEPDLARRLYERTVENIRQSGVRVETGVFAAHMAVTSVNDGPVTLLLDTEG